MVFLLLAVAAARFSVDLLLLLLLPVLSPLTFLWFLFVCLAVPPLGDVFIEEVVNISKLYGRFVLSIRKKS